MDQDGQLLFSDDPFLIGCNTAFQLIEEGKFAEALEKIDHLMSRNPDYPGLSETFRTARFWMSRIEDLEGIEEGKMTADFLMKEWEEFTRYAGEKGMLDSAPYNSAMKYIFFRASEHYTIAFVKEQSTVDNFDLLINLGICFVRLEDYRRAIETLEYARSSLRGSARLLALLGEAYYQINEIPKSLLHFKEAFFVNPSEIDLTLIRTKPVRDLIDITARLKPGRDVREWLPVFGYLQDIFYVKRRLNSQQVEAIKREIYTLETALQQGGRDRAEETNIIPRLINKYLWMLDYFEYQSYDFNSISEIRTRLLKLDRDLFKDYFARKQ
jgi:tetratricopeptide (TPR) repeat protein